MPIFDVKQSSQGSVAFSTGPATVDIGIGSECHGNVRRQHSGIQVTVEGLASDQGIDGAVDRMIEELEKLRSKAKELLGSLKR